MPGLAREADPVTARNAAINLKPKRKASIQDRILAWLRDGPDTGRETALGIHEEQVSVSPRFQELLEQGLVVPVPEGEDTDAASLVWQLTTKQERREIIEYLGDTRVPSAATLLSRILKQAETDATLKAALAGLPVTMKRQIRGYKRKKLFKEMVPKIGLRRFMARYGDEA